MLSEYRAVRMGREVTAFFIYIYIYIVSAHNEELKGLYSSPNIVRVIKSRRMRWGGHVALWGKEEEYTGCWWGNQRGRDRWVDPGVDGKIILGWTSRRWD